MPIKLKTTKSRSREVFPLEKKIKLKKITNMVKLKNQKYTYLLLNFDDKQKYNKKKRGMK